MSGLGATVVGAPAFMNEDENNPDIAVTLTNTANPMMKTQIVPGYMTLGTSWATASLADLKNSADGGAFGGLLSRVNPMPFSLTICVLTVKRTPQKMQLL